LGLGLPYGGQPIHPIIIGSMPSQDGGSQSHRARHTVRCRLPAGHVLARRPGSTLRLRRLERYLASCSRRSLHSRIQIHFDCFLLDCSAQLLTTRRLACGRWRGHHVRYYSTRSARTTEYATNRYSTSYLVLLQFCKAVDHSAFTFRSYIGLLPCKHDPCIEQSMMLVQKEKKKEKTH